MSVVGVEAVSSAWAFSIPGVDVSGNHASLMTFPVASMISMSGGVGSIFLRL